MWTMKTPRATASTPFASARFDLGRTVPARPRRRATRGLVHPVRPGHRVPEHAVERIGADVEMEERDRGDRSGDEERLSVDGEQDEGRLDLEGRLCGRGG